MKVNEEIDATFDLAEKNTKGISFEWFKRFFKLLEKTGVGEEKILSALKLALSDENLASTCISANRDGFNKDTKHTPAMIDEFFQYLDDLAQKMGEEEFRAFLEKSIDQIQLNFENHQGTTKTCFKNLFLKELVSLRKEDVVLVSKKTPVDKLSSQTDMSVIDMEIGGMKIGDIHFEEVDASTPTIIFTDFRVLPGMQKMGLGGHLFSEFCQQVSEHKKGYSVLAWNVVKGKDGSAVYPKWGAYPVKVAVEDDFWEIEKDAPLNEEETEEFYGDGSRVYYFSPEKIEEIAKRDKNAYGKQDSAKALKH